MEIAIALFMGVWLIVASLISYFWLKKDFIHFIDNKDKSGKGNNIDGHEKTSDNIIEIDANEEEQHG